MPRATVLLVTAEETLENQVRALVHAIKDCGLKILSDLTEAMSCASDDRISLRLLDVPDGNGVEAIIGFLEESAKRSVPAPVIALTHNDNPELRLKLLAAGALDCLVMPFGLSRLAFLADILTLRTRCGARSADQSRKEANGKSASRIDGFFFGSPAANKLLEQLHAVAPLDATILLSGETGVGKTHFARAIHSLSPRCGKPFLVVHCGALPPALLESELFGHVRGAFTHAERDRVGKLAEVQDGTLLLDEVDSVPCEAQVKLLRAVEERVFEPVGSNKSLRLRARLIAAANRPLEQEVAAGRFRADLYYRLNVISFCLPPLRQTQELIRPLAEKFLAAACVRDRREIRGFSAAALHALRAYPWPGNVRELRNVIDRAVALSTRPVIEPADLPDGFRQFANGALSLSAAKGGTPCRGVVGQLATPFAAQSVPPTPDCGNHLAHARMTAELQQLTEALKYHQNNRTGAAAALGISRVTLYKKLRRYGLL